MRGPRTAMKSGPHLPQREKALAQKQRPNTAINNKKKVQELKALNSSSWKMLMPRGRTPPGMRKSPQTLEVGLCLQDLAQTFLSSWLFEARLKQFQQMSGAQPPSPQNKSPFLPWGSRGSESVA